MAALHSRCGHYILPCDFDLSSFFFLLFFLAQSQRSAIGCLPYFHTWCGLSANLECMSEMCCTQLAEIEDAKNHHRGAIAQLCRAISWQHYCTASSSRLQPNFAALNRGRHSYSTGRPSRWALAHILVFVCNFVKTQRILIQFSLLDLQMNVTCEGMNFTHVT